MKSDDDDHKDKIIAISISSLNNNNNNKHRTSCKSVVLYFLVVLGNETMRTCKCASVKHIYINYAYTL